MPLARPSPAAAVVATALRFGGGGVATPDADRLKIPVDPPTAADLGATNFTVEFWMSATKADNSGGDAACNGANYSWINGRIIVDRDRFPGGASADGRDWGISLTSAGQVVFGVQNSGGSQWTTCTSGVDALDGAWHHVAVQRATTGLMQIWVDGTLRAQANGPSGDISYPNGAGTVRPGSDPFLVIGAEKHDAGSEFPSYRGLVDEIRLSTTMRYGAAFTRPSAPFSPDASTAALYHLDGNPGLCPATFSDASANGVTATCKPAGSVPELVTNTPFSGTPPPPPPPPPPPGTARFTPVTPYRLADTRPAPVPVAAGSVLEVIVAGQGGVPDNAQSASVNLTAVNPTGWGYLTAWPCGAAQPGTSNLNYASGQTVANLAVVSLGTGGKICVSPSVHATDILVDVSGWYAASGQRYEPAGPLRMVDTRPNRQGANVTLEVPVSAFPGVLAGATAASMNLTVVNPVGWGFVTAWPCGQPKPNASNLNYAPGQTIANLAVVGIGTGGKVCIATSAAASLLVDLTGSWGPGGTEELSPGLAASRLLDTRPVRVNGGGTVAVTLGAGTGVAVLNLTVTGGTAPGWLTAWPCTETRPGTSNLNYAAGQTIAGTSFVPPGSDGRVCVYVFGTTNVIVDLMGAMTT